MACLRLRHHPLGRAGLEEVVPELAVGFVMAGAGKSNRSAIAPADHSAVGVSEDLYIASTYLDWCRPPYTSQDNLLALLGADCVCTVVPNRES